MEALDRLGWAGGVMLAGDGVRVGIRSNDATLLDRLAGRFPPTWRRTRAARVEQIYSVLVRDGLSAGTAPRTHHLFVNSERRRSSRDVGVLLDDLESTLHFQAALSARRRLFLHAGVVEWGGRAILVPGRSGTGKSSLVAALVAAGAQYYSDEFAVVDASGRVHAYPKRISLREPMKSAGQYTANLGGRRRLAPLKVGGIVVTEYQAGAAWQPRALSPGRALLALLDNTVLARSRASFALSALNTVVRDSVAVKSKRPEAGEVASAVLQFMDSPAGVVRRS